MKSNTHTGHARGGWRMLFGKDLDVVEKLNEAVAMGQKMTGNV